MVLVPYMLWIVVFEDAMVKEEQRTYFAFLRSIGYTALKSKVWKAVRT
jgi:hypothetical protein